MAWRLHPTRQQADHAPGGPPSRTPVGRRPQNCSPSRRPRFLHRPDRERRHPPPADGRSAAPAPVAGAASVPSGAFFRAGGAVLSSAPSAPVSPIPDAPAVFSIRVPRRRRDVPKSRGIAVGLLLAALVIGVAVPSGADDLATAKSRQKKMQAALDDATRELDQIETEQSFAEQRLQAANSRLGYVRDDLAAARRALSGHVSSLYKAGGTRPLSGILASSADVVVSRVEFETILQEGQVAAVADAKVAYDSYEAAIRDVKAAMAQQSKLEARSKATVAELTRTFEKAKQTADKLAGFNTTHLVNGRFVSCPVSKPYSFVDSWGAPRSGGRAHKGTDLMNPWGNKVHAIVDGVVSRQSTSSLGGISLYLMGADGNEYYYAHLSRYASSVGQRVKAGELIAYNGQTGNARFTAPHVHFEVHPGAGAPVNPYPYVKAACG